MNAYPIPHPRAGLRLAFALCCLLLTGCVGIPSDFKDPRVSLVAIEPRIKNLFAPEFDVLLRVINPNRVALKIEGIDYRIRLRGIELIQGVATELPEIAAYGEAEVRLNAIADLAGGLSLLQEILRTPEEPVDFELNADLDLGTFYPMVRIKRRGSITLQ